MLLEEMTTLWDKIRHNHLLLMAVCCLLPLLALLVITYGFGIRNNYIYWAAILLCPLSHLIMMKFTEHGEDKDGKKGGCH